MADALSVLDMTRKKLATKVERLRTQLAAAETELEESETAIRVLTRLGISPSVEAAPEEGRGHSQARVLDALPYAETEAKAPKEVHAALVAAGVTNITPDNVRTILSRLTKPDANGHSVVLTKDSKYWRAGQAPAEEAEDDAEDVYEDTYDDGLPTFDRPDDSPFGTRSEFDTELDSDIPF